VWLNIILAVATVIASLAAALAYRESHTDRGKAQRQEQIDHSLIPLDGRIGVLESQFKAAIERNAEILDGAISRSMQPLREDIAVLKNQVEVFWKSVAIDAAQILHQPDPEREHIDKLLEALMEDTLTPEEELRLRKYLVTIRNWEPGQDVGFPVRDGEQTAAAILLRTMKHVITPRGTGGETADG
jgi:hypothetical protein